MHLKLFMQIKPVPGSTVVVAMRLSHHALIYLLETCCNVFLVQRNSPSNHIYILRWHTQVGGGPSGALTKRNIMLYGWARHVMGIDVIEASTAFVHVRVATNHYVEDLKSVSKVLPAISPTPVWYLIIWTNSFSHCSTCHVRAPQPFKYVLRHRGCSLKVWTQVDLICYSVPANHI